MLPFEFDTIAVSDGISMGSEGMRMSLVSREWIADSVELVVRAQGYDGLFAIAGCDKTLPGMLPAMIRLDVPAVFAYGGSKLPGRIDGKDISLQDVYEAIGAHASGKIDDARLDQVERAACPGIGTCAGMFSANTMASVSEALGLTVPGMAAPPAEDDDRRLVTDRAAHALAQAMRYQVRPSDVLSKRSFENAATVASALGGSTNAILHRAGGVPAVIRELLDAGIAGDARTVTGKTIVEEVASVSHVRHPVLRTAADPVKPRGGYAVLFGSLAPDGAVSKWRTSHWFGTSGPLAASTPSRPQPRRPGAAEYPQAMSW